MQGMHPLIELRSHKTQFKPLHSNFLDRDLSLSEELASDFSTRGWLHSPNAASWHHEPDSHGDHAA
ncbi:hypothetical protein JMJ78_0000548 [Colletotrichum scovillei]|nr:hypothetical protein JMJ78_0000548 [Colletotrichum scovillei]